MTTKLIKHLEQQCIALIFRLGIIKSKCSFKAV